MKAKNQALDVWGDFACFSRPEMKVERFSYPVITPSAARGIYDAIYCKPTEFRWQITKIEILKPPSYIALRRNEVKDKISEKALVSYMDGKKEPEPIFADLNADTKGRTQRQTMALKNVQYRLHAEIRPWDGFENRLNGMEEQFRRRAKHGKCIYQPYFDLSRQYDSRNWQKENFNLSISLFKPEIKNGVLMVPDYESPEVFKVRGGGS